MTGTSGSDTILYHVDGELVPVDEATVSVDDRGFRYGDAAFETLRAYGGTVFEWDAHADRLDRTCETLGIDHGLDRGDLRARVDETLAANGLADAYVRLSITRGVQPGKLTPHRAVDPTVVIWVKPLPRGGVGGSDVWDGPATVQTVETRRIPNDALPAAAKTHNYLNGILARLELRGTGADEALLLDGDGHLTEGATSNLFFVDGGVLKTPATDGPVLPGITRRVVLDLAGDLGVPTAVGAYGRSAVEAADEVFLTNSTWELRPVARVDGTPVGEADGCGGPAQDPTDRVDHEVVDPGPVTGRLQSAFDRLVEECCY
ncbi:aminotransferase class IV [Halovivax cerinus]|uniref:Aminotransferase class IV n=1 Tax=Halovivax cerinus TaxID=1487865 RepID=A0ABD5NJP1_9EURY|nr:aminotransferase class IV [Halovivax cerinus]